MAETVACLMRNRTRTQPPFWRYISAEQPRSAALIGWQRGSTTTGMLRGRPPPCCLRW